ncbi:MAG: hypothetical protein WD775_11060 [Burkholderiales bacterium]
MKRHLADLRASFGQVFAEPSYLALAALPLDGAEFGILSVGLLFLLLVLLSRAIAQPEACALP